MSEIFNAILQEELAPERSLLERIVESCQRINEPFVPEDLPGLRVENVFSDSGLLISQLIFDENGTLRQSLTVDENGLGPEGRGFEPWSFEMSFFDETGEIELFFRSNDDFTSTALYYEDDGIYRIEVKEGVTKQFDEDGRSQVKLKELPNGRTLETTCNEDGDIVRKVTHDPYSPGPILNPSTPFEPSEPEVKGTVDWILKIQEYHPGGPAPRNR
ncbi:MAG: hypothetical protein AAGH74_10390 [Pseudomonadota bacterium]